MSDYAGDGEKDTQQLSEAEVAGDVGTALKKMLLR